VHYAEASFQPMYTTVIILSMNELEEGCTPIRRCCNGGKSSSVDHCATQWEASMT
jgi:hypothetical protein